MSLDTYANLQTEIAQHLDRDDLTDHIPTFITLAEETHRRPTDEGGLRIRQMITREAITVDARQVSLPDGFLNLQTLRLLTTPATELKYIDYHELNRVRQETTGKPRYFTIGNEFEFDYAPDSSYSGEIVYFKEETALSDSNESNNILAQVPGAYLYGALVASAPFLMDDPRIVVWQTLYRAAAQGANAATKKARRGKHLVARNAGSTP